jgi:DNA-directed RNA polymerase specialized sigma24 family protein
MRPYTQNLHGEAWHSPDLAPDLDWVLNNADVSDADLCEWLLDEFGSAFARFCQALGVPLEQITERVGEAIVQAVLERHTFWGQTTGKAWLYARLWRVCASILSEKRKPPASLTISASPPDERSLDSEGWLPMLIYEYGFSIPEISCISGVSEQQLQSKWEALRAKLCQLSESDAERDLENYWKQTLHPGNELASVWDEDHRAQRLVEIHLQVSKRQTRMRLVSRALEISLALLLVASVGALAWLFNQFTPQPPAPPVIPSALARYVPQPPLQKEDWLVDLPQIVPLPAPAPLPLDASLDEIQQRALQSSKLWQTLWVDMAILQYGLPGSPDPPRLVERRQVWMARPFYARVIYGANLNTPDGTYTLAGNQMYWRSFSQPLVYTNLNFNQALDTSLSKLTLPTHLFADQQGFSISGSEIIAQRPTLVLDWRNSRGDLVYRFWMDREYGLTLKRREFWGGDGKHIAEDVFVGSAIINAELPAYIFHPLEFSGEKFAADPSGTPISYGEKVKVFWEESLKPAAASSYSMLPNEMNPAHLPLTFRRVPLGEVQEPQGEAVALEQTLPARIEIFAGEYYLGELPIAAASVLACERSQDGRWIVLSSLSHLFQEEGAALYWIDLRQLSVAHRALHSNRTNDAFAISPDSRTLAYFGCADGTSDCGAYLLNLESGEAARLHTAAFVDYFLWSPDSTALGFLQSRSGRGGWQYLIYRVADGSLQYRGEFDWRKLRAAAGSPSLDWRTHRSTRVGGLEGCAGAAGY